MAGPSGRDRGPPSGKRRTPIASDEELKRTLERDTAVQGAGEEEVARETRRPAQADKAPPTARPTPRSDESK